MFINRDYQKMYSDGTVRQFNRRNDRFMFKVYENNIKNKAVEQAILKQSTENPYTKKVDYTVKLCQAIKDEDKSNFVAERNVQRIHHFEELKVLQNQLRAAYALRGLFVQNVENQALGNKDAFAKHYANEALHRGRCQDKEFFQNSYEQSRKKQLQLKEALQEQIKEKQRRLQGRKQRTVNDRRIVDKQMQREKEDMEREEREKIEKKKNFRAELETFMQAQADWKKAHPAEDRRLHVDHVDIVWQYREKNVKLEDERKAKLEAKIKRNEEIGRKFQQEAERKKKFDEGFLDLLVEEVNAKEECKIRQKKEKRRQEAIADYLSLKERMTLKYQYQIEARKQMKIDYERNVAHFKAYQEEQQLLAEEKRKKMIESRKEMEAIINEKRLYKAQEMNRLLREDVERIEAAKKREKTLEASRLEVLNEHNPDLFRYLPRKALTPSEWKYVSTLTK